MIYPGKKNYKKKRYVHMLIQQNNKKETKGKEG